MQGLALNALTVYVQQAGRRGIIRDGARHRQQTSAVGEEGAFQEGTLGGAAWAGTWTKTGQDALGAIGQQGREPREPTGPGHPRL